MMKVLEYSKVNGTQDRDDTMLVARIVSSAQPSLPSEGGDGATVVDQSNGEYLEPKEVRVMQVSATNSGQGPLSPSEMSTVGGNIVMV